MKNLNVSDLGLVELNQSEAANVNGGWGWHSFFSAVVVVAVVVVNVVSCGDPSGCPDNSASSSQPVA